MDTCPCCGSSEYAGRAGYNTACAECGAVTDVNTGQKIEMPLSFAQTDVINLTGDIIGDLVDPSDYQGMGEEPEDVGKSEGME